jgi:hypothetical protein
MRNFIFYVTLSTTNMFGCGFIGIKGVIIGIKSVIILSQSDYSLANAIDVIII